MSPSTLLLPDIKHDTGIIHQYVYPAEFLEHKRPQRANMFFIYYIQNVKGNIEPLV